MQLTLCFSDKGYMETYMGDVQTKLMVRKKLKFININAIRNKLYFESVSTSHISHEKVLYPELRIKSSCMLQYSLL